MIAASSSRESLTGAKSDAAAETVENVAEPKLKTGLIENVRKLWDSVRMTVFVVGTALTVFVAARNTITWYVFNYRIPNVCVVCYVSVGNSLTSLAYIEDYWGYGTLTADSAELWTVLPAVGLTVNRILKNDLQKACHHYNVNE